MWKLVKLPKRGYFLCWESFNKFVPFSPVIRVPKSLSLNDIKICAYNGSHYNDDQGDPSEYAVFAVERRKVDTQFWICCYLHWPGHFGKAVDVRRIYVHQNIIVSARTSLSAHNIHVNVLAARLLFSARFKFRVVFIIDDNRLEAVPWACPGSRRTWKGPSRFRACVWATR